MNLDNRHAEFLIYGKDEHTFDHAFLEYFSRIGTACCTPREDPAPGGQTAT